jgi:hypothetical protein
MRAIAFALWHNRRYRAVRGRWRGEEGPMVSSFNDNGDPRTVRELTDRIEASWQGWVDAVEGIPETRLAEPMVGHWSTKDLLGHVAFWEDWVIGDCRRILSGGSDSGEDLDEVNQRQVAESKDASVAAQKRYRDEAHARLTAFLATIPEGEPAFPQLVATLGDETWGHYDEHADQVRAWRAAEGI